jgi:hypothetical protein
MYVLCRLQCKPTVPFQYFIMFFANVLTFSSFNVILNNPLIYLLIVSSFKPCHYPSHSFTFPLLQPLSDSPGNSVTLRPPPHPQANPLLQWHNDPWIHSATPAYPLAYSPTHSLQHTHPLQFIVRLSDSLSPVQPKMHNYAVIYPHLLHPCTPAPLHPTTLYSDTLHTNTPASLHSYTLKHTPTHYFSTPLHSHIPTPLHIYLPSMLRVYIAKPLHPYTPARLHPTPLYCYAPTPCTAAPLHPTPYTLVLLRLYTLHPTLAPLQTTTLYSCTLHPSTLS